VNIYPAIFVGYINSINIYPTIIVGYINCMNIFRTIFVGYINCLKKQGEEPKLTIFARSTKICLQHWIGQIDLNRTFNTKRQYVKLLFYSICPPLLSITDLTRWRTARQLVTIKSSDNFAHSSVMAVFRELMLG